MGNQTLTTAGEKQVFLISSVPWMSLVRSLDQLLSLGGLNSLPYLSKYFTQYLDRQPKETVQTQVICLLRKHLIRMYTFCHSDNMFWSHPKARK